MNNVYEYQKWTRKTAKYPKGPAEFEASLPYLVMGLAGEAGEVANKYKKIIRDQSGILEDKDEHEIISELGDVMWYLTRIADELGYGIYDIMDHNYHKLESRLARGAIGGSGDNR